VDTESFGRANTGRVETSKPGHNDLNNINILDGK
jgi:hypothetical protein